VVSVNSMSELRDDATNESLAFVLTKFAGESPVNSGIAIAFDEIDSSGVTNHEVERVEGVRLVDLGHEFAGNLVYERRYF